MEAHSSARSSNLQKLQHTFRLKELRNFRVAPTLDDDQLHRPAAKNFVPIGDDLAVRFQRNNLVESP